jgi:formylglycine-generating enzyme required for sulfatase activity
MGSHTGDPDEKPAHKVTLRRSFYLGKFEVTQEQWEAVMQDNPSLNKGEPEKRAEWIKRPVDRVNWEDVQAFLDAVNEKYAPSGMRFDLPTEAQWEWACKAGFSNRVGASDDPALLADYAWYGGNSDRETHPVGTKKANDWGLYDMHGNVAEFCQDVASKADAAKIDMHVVRGGNWQEGETGCRSTARYVRPGKVSLRYDGLRLICTKK